MNWFILFVAGLFEIEHSRVRLGGDEREGEQESGGAIAAAASRFHGIAILCAFRSRHREAMAEG